MPCGILSRRTMRLFLPPTSFPFFDPMLCSTWKISRATVYLRKDKLPHTHWCILSRTRYLYYPFDPSPIRAVQEEQFPIDPFSIFVGVRCACFYEWRLLRCSRMHLTPFETVVLFVDRVDQSLCPARFATSSTIPVE